MPIVLSSGDEEEDEVTKLIKAPAKVAKKEDSDSDDSSSEELETGLVRKRVAMQDTVYAYTPWTPRNKAKLIEMKNDGVSWEKLSDIFNLHPSSLQLRYDEVLSPEAFHNESWSFDDQVKLIEWCTKSFKLLGFINFPTLSKKLNKEIEECKAKWESFKIPLGKKRKLQDPEVKPKKRSNVYDVKKRRGGRSNVYKARTLSESEGDYSDSSESEGEEGVKKVLEQAKLKITPQKKLKRKKRQKLIRAKVKTKSQKERKELEELWEVAERLQPTRRTRRAARKQGFWSEKMEEFEEAFEPGSGVSEDIDYGEFGY